jgi:WD40 repeat protein
VAIYDLERLTKPVWEQQAHKSIINAIDGCGGLEIGYGAPEIVTGGRDGCVRLWDPRINEPVLALEPGEGQPGVITMQIRNTLLGIQHGTIADTHNWVHKVL